MNQLYGDLFRELQVYYDRAVDTDPAEYTERKYVKELDEALAIHLALAFAHFEDFGFESSLFQKFWTIPNTKRHKEFISFLGRSCISRDQAGDEWFKENKVSKERLVAFWEWILEQGEEVEAEALSGFGFWVNPNKEILDFEWLALQMAKTMKKAKGQIDWDYGLMEQLPKRFLK